MFVKPFVPQNLKKEVLRRWVVVLPADEEMKEPALEFEVKVVSDRKLSALAKSIDTKQRRGTTWEEEVSFRKKFIVEVVTGWRGCTVGNAKRLCLVLLENPELIDESAPKDWPFDFDTLVFFAEHMSGESFNEITRGALDVEAFAREEVFKAKKSLTHSLDSHPQSTPQSSANATDQMTQTPLTGI